MDNSFSQISFNHGGNTSVNYQDPMDGNSSPTQRLNYIKPNQNNGSSSQRKPSLLYQHYTNNNENTSRVMSENISNYSTNNDYYMNNIGNQSFNNTKENIGYNNIPMNSMMDSSFWTENGNNSPTNTNNGFNNASQRNITAPVFKNNPSASAASGYAGYSPNATNNAGSTLINSAFQQRGNKSPVSALYSPSPNANTSFNLKRAISIKNNGLNSNVDLSFNGNDHHKNYNGNVISNNKGTSLQKIVDSPEIPNADDPNYSMQLKIKDAQIESLENEIESLKKTLKLRTTGSLKNNINRNGDLTSQFSDANFSNNEDTKNKKSANSNNKDKLDSNGIDELDCYQDSFFFQLAKRNTSTLDDELYVFPEIPNSINELISRLSKTNENSFNKIDDLETRLDSLITAIMMNPMNINGNVNSLNNVSTEHGRYDEEAIAHKLVVRLETLTKENEEMGKMLSYGRSKEMQIDIKLLQRENELLNKRIKELESKKK
ncbi:hypothetical protein FOG51_01024 [Hanseniaspora uvarum]|nr:hypothetical protein FOG51_01024 [Hanseniaspora uvarum]